MSLAFFTISWLEQALGVTPRFFTEAQNAHGSQPLESISTDTRSLEKDSLFVALSGEQSDGHTFLESAMKRGAVALVVKEGTSIPLNFPGVAFFVKDTLEAYRAIAKAWRKEFPLPLAAIGGSAGKTTSKELLAALLRGKYASVHQTKASQNGFQGIPATLLGLGLEHDAAVIEVGIDEPNTMEQHLEIVAPLAGLLSSIGPEHLEKLIDVATVAKEEGKLFAYLAKHKGFAAVNASDPLVLAESEKYPGLQKIYYGLENAPKAKSPMLAGRVDGQTLRVQGLSEKEESFALPMEGKHNALNLLGAIALASHFGVSPEQMRSGLKHFSPPPGRSEIYTWRGNVKVFADTYNANPVSVTAALEMLAEQKGAGSTWLVLGDMLELGSLEESLHRGLADPIFQYSVQNVLLHGPRMLELAKELRKRKFSGILEHHPQAEVLAERLAVFVKPGDRILIKGSRGMRMEKVWEKLQSL